MGRFGKRRICALLCGLSSVFCDFGQALAMEGTGTIKNEVVVNKKRRERRKHIKLRKQNMIGKNVDMRKIDNGEVVEVVEKDQVEKTFAEKGYEWVMNNKKKSLLLTALLADSAWSGINEICLSTIYKKLDDYYMNGGGSSSVEKYVYRSGNKENPKVLVVKSINRLYPADNFYYFRNERFACKVIPELADKNKNLARIIDYHYGLTHNYVVYEDVGADYDWKNEMKNWSDDQKFEWLEDVIGQMVDVNLFLFDEGYYHGDFKLDNLSIVKGEDNKPLVRVFDYGLFGKKAKMTRKLNLEKICSGFFDLCCEMIFGKERVRTYGWLDRLWNAKHYAEVNKVREENINRLFLEYPYKRLVTALKGLRENLGKMKCVLGVLIYSDDFEKVLRDFRNKINQKNEKK